MKVVFHDLSTKLKTVTDLETTARGGMVSSLFKVTDYLCGRGHEVIVFSDIEEPGWTKKGVFWTNVDKGFDDRGIRILVTNRGTGSGYSELHAKHRVLWTHDLPHSGFIPEPDTIKAYSMTVFMSTYAQKIWKKFYKQIGPDTQIPNGVDEKLFYPRQKDFGYLIYCSHPNRGLGLLPYIFDAVSNRIGFDIKLRAYSSAKMYPNEGDMKDHIGDTLNLNYPEAKCEGYEQLDPVPQHRLAEEIGKAGLMIMPSGYPEICSNSILQSIASGTPCDRDWETGSNCSYPSHLASG